MHVLIDLFFVVWNWIDQHPWLFFFALEVFLFVGMLAIIEVSLHRTFKAIEAWSHAESPEDEYHWIYKKVQNIENEYKKRKIFWKLRKKAIRQNKFKKDRA